MIHILLAIIYLSFISLGLPNSLLGSAWPAMYGDLGVPVSYAGIISMIIAAASIFSILQNDRLTRKFGAGKVTAISVGMTAVTLIGFSYSHSFWLLCLLAIPYGLSAGSVDAVLNSYVALHYSSRYMSWLHCMWGIGATLGPYIMGYALAGGQSWGMGYRYIGVLQIILTFFLVACLPLWKRNTGPALETENHAAEKALTIKEVIRIPGIKEIMITLFCYCALEQTTARWGGSVVVLQYGVTPEEAARFTGHFFIGLTIGRAVSGFLTIAKNDTDMVNLGLVIIFAGICAFVFPAGKGFARAGLVLIGFGCAPIYPSIIHSVPEHFGVDTSQAIIGVLMAGAHVGICLMPPLFGLITEHIGISLLPVYLVVLLVITMTMHDRMIGRRIKEILSSR